MRPRRQQASITFQSDWAKERLKLLTRDGRSQAAVIEEGLRRLPVPSSRISAEELEKRQAELEEILAKVDRAPIMTMAEFDALEYDEFGNLR